MNELPTDFQSLPEEYQRVILLAQDQHQISVTPLQLLVGGWSGAVVYLVSVAWNETRRLEHCILKLDRKGKSAKSDEVTRHNAVNEKSPPEFARAHIPELVFDRVEHEGAIAIFYRIAGQSLLKYRPLSSYGQQSQLKTIFTHTNDILLKEWNGSATFQQAVHPQKVLEKWLGFRLDESGNIERFLQQTCQVHPAIEGLLINGHVFSNPLLYARKAEPWGRVRSMDIATGFIHGDLNTNNILVKFGDDKTALEGYCLIDFALFKEGMPLLFDQRYLEMSYLLHTLSQIPFGTWVNFVTLLAVADVPDPHKVPIEASGTSAVIASARGAFSAWVQENHPSLHDDLWGQYWLAGVAAGLAYCHKTGLPKEARLAGLIYACANLRRYSTTFKLLVPTRVELLYDEEQSRADTLGASRTKKSHPNLPAQPTPFIGRATQIKVLKDLILNPDVRLVTLLGPGGTGKTRLSLQVAQEALDHFPQGVFFVALADDTDANQFVSRVAQQLEVREGGRPLLENVKDYLRDKHLLLVLDNFEQLVSTAPIVAEMLAEASQLKIITTSRIALQLHGEREYPVPPLNLPKPGDISVEDLAGNESVSLFVERAQGSNPNFTLTRENAPAVAKICRSLDGLPLALELAAARAKLLPPQAILTRLDDRLKLLTGGARDIPSRHQTLRNTLEWSYSLLNAEEKTLYPRLGVFVGGFSIEAAEAVCNANKNLDILDGLTSLINNSMLRQEEIEGEPRFSMLETIRAYALERLGEVGEMERLRERHARYFGNIVVEQTWPLLTSAKALHWLNWLEREYDNIRATLTWCLSAPEGIDLGAQLVFALEWFWYRRGYFMEGRMWCERVLASPLLRVDSLERATALVSSASMALWLGKPELGMGEAQEALALGFRHEDEDIISTSTFGLAVMFINMGLDRQAEPLLAQARAFFKERNLPYYHVATSVHLGNVELGLGNLDRARALHEEALTEARGIGENWILSFALNNLGEVARTQGQYDLARSYYEECEALLRDTGDTGDLARFVHSLGYVAQHEGDYARAESQFRKSLTMFRRLGNRRGIAECLAGLAGLKARQGEVEWGATLLSAAESLLKATGGAWWPADRVEVEANQEMLHSALSESELTVARKKGEAMTLEQALAFASEGQTLS
jgi:predicted ATPase